MRKWLAEPETRPLWTDAEDEVLGVDGNWHTSNKATLWRWRQACQNDFAARMDWTIKPVSQANHRRRGRTRPCGTVDRQARRGASISVRAARATPTAITCRTSGSIIPRLEASRSNPAAAARPGHRTRARVGSRLHRADQLLPRGTMHIILAVTDDGSPALTRYRA
jgi:hypothetical protein